MPDYIKISINNQSEARGGVVADGDGMFAIEIVARANGNGHGQPLIWAEISVNGEKVEEQRIGWKDGPGSIIVHHVHKFLSSEAYKVTGIAGNENADATSIDMTIKRIV